MSLEQQVAAVIFEWQNDHDSDEGLAHAVTALVAQEIAQQIEAEANKAGQHEHPLPQRMCRTCSKINDLLTAASIARSAPTGEPE